MQRAGARGSLQHAAPAPCLAALARRSRETRARCRTAARSPIELNVRAERTFWRLASGWLPLRASTQTASASLISRATRHWQPIASRVTMKPARASVRKRSGMAVIFQRPPALPCGQRLRLLLNKFRRDLDAGAPRHRRKPLVRIKPVATVAPRSLLSALITRMNLGDLLSLEQIIPEMKTSERWSAIVELVDLSPSESPAPARSRTPAARFSPR